MLQITFQPKSKSDALITAAMEYQHLWETEGERIVTQIEVVSGLHFVEQTIEATVFEGISRSYPLRLRASYPLETKRGTLIHELCHRLVDNNNNRPYMTIGSYQPEHQLEEHQVIDLILFDIWTDLYGEAFARQQVLIESQRQAFYKLAWEQTLAMQRSERAAKFRSLIR